MICLVSLYNISTIIDYLTPNLVYTYTINDFGTNLVDKHFKEPKLIFLVPS